MIIPQLKTLDITSEEEVLLRTTATWMYKYMIRLSLDPAGRLYSDSLVDRQDDAKKIDEVIAGGMDRLRPVIKQDFFEKIYDIVVDEANRTNDKDVVLLWIRMLDSLKYVLSITKRFRGNPFVSSISSKLARIELTKRGLWKAK